MASSSAKDGKISPGLLCCGIAFHKSQHVDLTCLSAVTVILSAQFPPDDLLFPNRRLRLTKEKPKVPVGRTSNRNNEFKPSFENAFVDSPVMSRTHAEISADFDNSRVYIKDVGSMHGTFVEGEKLHKNIQRAIHHGDLVTFGASVRNHPSDIIQPTRFKVAIEFGTM
jgi:pSer/pThr/pTyr-binding forkhead associated (FHA) protein